MFGFLPDSPHPQPPDPHCVERGSFRLVFPLSTQWRGGQGVRFLKRCPLLSHTVERGSGGEVNPKVTQNTYPKLRLR